MTDYEKQKAEIARLHEVCREYREELEALESLITLEVHDGVVKYPFEFLQTYHHFIYNFRQGWVKECLTDTDYAGLIQHLTEKWKWYYEMHGSMGAVTAFIQYVLIRDKDMFEIFMKYINKHHKNKW